MVFIQYYYFFFFILEYTKIAVFNGIPRNIEINSEIIDTKGNCTPNFFLRYPIDVCMTSGLYIDDKIIICGGIFMDRPTPDYILHAPASKDCYQFNKGATSFESNPGNNKMSHEILVSDIMFENY